MIMPLSIYSSLDAASNNSVENIRSLIEQVLVSNHNTVSIRCLSLMKSICCPPLPSNAFLKTLEEPPSYAIFILARRQKTQDHPYDFVRCQVFDFKRIQTTDDAKQLQDISKKEGINAEMKFLYMSLPRKQMEPCVMRSNFDKIAGAN